MVEVSAARPQKKLGKYKGAIRSLHDLEQDVAFIAWQKRSSFADLHHFHSWVVRKAEWLALDELRAKSRTQRVFSEMEQNLREASYVSE